MFDDRRVVVLGPASYPWMWQAQCIFDQLKANLDIERQLDQREIRNWFEPMLATKNAC